MKLQFHNADPENVDQFIKFLREGGRELLTDRVYIKLGNIGSQMNILEHTILHMGANMKRENQFFINRLRLLIYDWKESTASVVLPGLRNRSMKPGNPHKKKEIHAEIYSIVLSCV